MPKCNEWELRAVYSCKGAGPRGGELLMPAGIIGLLVAIILIIVLLRVLGIF